MNKDLLNYCPILKLINIKSITKTFLNTDLMQRICLNTNYLQINNQAINS